MPCAAIRACQQWCRCCTQSVTAFSSSYGAQTCTAQCEPAPWRNQASQSTVQDAQRACNLQIGYGCSMVWYGAHLLLLPHPAGVVACFRHTASHSSWTLLGVFSGQCRGWCSSPSCQTCGSGMLCLELLWLHHLSPACITPQGSTRTVVCAAKGSGMNSKCVPKLVIKSG